jgi:ribosomal protein S18 acetylase RimI-like enzyme
MDIKDILELQHTAYRSEAEIYSDYSIEPLTQTLADVEEELKNGIMLKAVVDGKVIGSVRAYERDGTVFIRKLMVLTEYRNRGVGRQLLQAIENEYQGKRCEIFTGAKSEKNIALYKKCGYVVFKTEKIGPGLTFVYMEKKIALVREIVSVDYPLLEDFLYHAIFVPRGAEAPPRRIIYNPDVFLYIEGFGSKPGDCGVVAEVGDKVVGAAWERIIPAYGHLGDDIPELAISVLPEYRGGSVGTVMMTRLFELLREQGYKQTSLAVQKENAAVRFYQRLGYRTVRESDEEYIMVKDLDQAVEDTAKKIFDMKSDNQNVTQIK